MPETKHGLDFDAFNLYVGDGLDGGASPDGVERADVVAVVGAAVEVEGGELDNNEDEDEEEFRMGRGRPMMFACGTCVGPDPYPCPLLLAEAEAVAAAWAEEARVFSLLGARWTGLGFSEGKEDVLREKAGFCCGLRVGDDDGAENEGENEVGGDSEAGDRVGDTDGDRGLPPTATAPPPERAVSGDRLDAPFILPGIGDVGDVLFPTVLLLWLLAVEIAPGAWSNDDRRPGTSMGLEFLLILAFLTGTFLPSESNCELLLLLLLLPVPLAFSLLAAAVLLLLLLRMVEELGLYLLLCVVGRDDFRANDDAAVTPPAPGLASLGGTAGLYWEGVSCLHPDPAPVPTPPDAPDTLPTLLTEEADEAVESDEKVEVVDDRGEEDVDATEDDDAGDDVDNGGAEEEETTDESPDAAVMDLRLAIFADAAVAEAVAVVEVVDPPADKDVGEDP